MPRVKASKKIPRVEGKQNFGVNNVQNGNKVPLDERHLNKTKNDIHLPLTDDNAQNTVEDPEMVLNAKSKSGREKKKIEPKTRKVATKRRNLQNGDDHLENGITPEYEIKTIDNNSAYQNIIDPHEIGDAINEEAASVSGKPKKTVSKRRRPNKEVSTATGDQASVDESPKKKSKLEINIPVKQELEIEKQTLNNDGTPQKNTKNIASKKNKSTSDSAGQKVQGRKRGAGKTVVESEVNNERMENINESKLNSVKQNNIDQLERATDVINEETASVSGTQKKTVLKRSRPKKEVLTDMGDQASVDKILKKKSKLEINVPVKQELEIEKQTLNNDGTPQKNTKNIVSKKNKSTSDNAGKKVQGRKRIAGKTVVESEVNNERMENVNERKLNSVKQNNIDQLELATDAINEEAASVSVTQIKTVLKRSRPKKQVLTDMGGQESVDESPKKKSKLEIKNVAAKINKKATENVGKKITNRRGAAKSVAESEVVNDGMENGKKSKKALINSIDTAYNKADFDLSLSAADSNVSDVSTNGNHQRTILKISSWNVAGLRSWLKKDGLKYLEYEEPDIFCMQEIKCTMDQLPEEAARIPGYHPYWLCLPGGYAGVALYSKIMPINVEYGIGNEEFDDAGRLITAEYEKFYLVNVYVPNSGRKLVNLEARMRWEKLFQAYIKKLDVLKPVIITGDMNVSHQEIDLANPKANTRSAGFTIEERNMMTELLSLGFVDTYRKLYPEKRGAYTYWTYMAKARSRNVGWRLDYFLVSERIVKRVVENAIRSQCMGSDHCPITLFINM